jgi:hypothetical protein
MNKRITLYASKVRPLGLLFLSSPCCHPHITDNSKIPAPNNSCLDDCDRSEKNKKQKKELPNITQTKGMKIFLTKAIFLTGIFHKNFVA